MPAAEEESVKGQSYISLIVPAVVLGVISAQKRFLHEPDAKWEVLKRG